MSDDIEVQRVTATYVIQQYDDRGYGADEKKAAAATALKDLGCEIVSHSERMESDWLIIVSTGYTVVTA